jgi:peptide/nickel transport system permease protein
MVDIPVIMGVTLVAAIGIIIGNLAADLIMPFVDPRMRVQ